jgi:tight adherence protein C
MIQVGLLALLAAATIFAFVLILLPGSRDVSTQLRDAAWTKRPENASERATSARERNSLQANLARAGWQGVKPETMRTRSVTLAGVAFVFVILLFAILRDLGAIALEIAAFAAAVAAYVPFVQLNSAVKKRKADIVRAFPDFLDMLASTVQAGLAINAAFQTAAPTLKGPLGDELRTALSEMRLGRSRADALRGMAERIDNVDVTNAMRAIVQAEKLGTSLSRVLEELSSEGRERRIMSAEEFAAQVPVKMTIPMALFMLPAIFTIIFGAIIADYFTR